MPSVEAISANTPIGDRYMIQITMRIMTSFMPSKNEATGRALLPTIMMAVANSRQNTISGSRFVFAAAFTRFGVTSERMMSCTPMVVFMIS